jgi:predicted thioredoxin/glutaredoxin
LLAENCLWRTFRKILPDSFLVVINQQPLRHQRSQLKQYLRQVAYWANDLILKLKKKRCFPLLPHTHRLLNAKLLREMLLLKAMVSAL